MSNLPPTIDELAAAETDRDRALWLLRAPSSLLLSHQLEIRAVIASVGFMPGLTAIAAEVAALCAVRDRHGYTPESMIMTRNLARTDLAIIAYGGKLGEVR